MPRTRRTLAWALAACAALAAATGARVLLTVEEALALAFPGAEIQRLTVFLTLEQQQRAEELAGGRLGSAIAHPYVATKDGTLVGTAYFESHVVRTLAETVMITVDPEGRIGRVEVLSFDEPPEYLPRAEWYRQFAGKPLDAELELRRAIRPVAGATLTARATTDAARRALALHRVLSEPGERSAGGPPAPSTDGASRAPVAPE